MRDLSEGNISMKIIKTVKPEFAKKMRKQGFTYTLEHLHVGLNEKPQVVWCFSLDDDALNKFVSLFSDESSDFFVSDTLCF